jgi:hypothetical protein
VTLADPCLVGSDISTAPIVTVGVAGASAGAVYSPDVDMVPAVAVPPGAPFTDHVTVEFGSFFTVAANCCAPIPACTFAPAGDTDTAPAAVIVTVAAPDLVESATDTARTATVAGLGALAGAEYTPAVDIVPTVALPPVMPFTCHVTVFVEPFTTVAEKACVPDPACTIADDGETLTDTTSGALVISTLAAADCVVSATDVAVTVTVGSAGGVAGAA